MFFTFSLVCNLHVYPIPSLFHLNLFRKGFRLQNSNQSNVSNICISDARIELANNFLKATLKYSHPFWFLNAAIDGNGEV